MIRADEAAAAIWSDRVSGTGAVPMPGPVFGSYPLRDPPTLSGSPTWAWLDAWWRAPPSPPVWRRRRAAAKVRQALARWRAMPEVQVPGELTRLRAALAVRGFTPALSARAMGAVALRLHQQRGWQVHDEQVMGADWMLGNRLIEMATGEGKSLTVVLAASVAALAGVPVHVMTANDYLARRDAQDWAPLYESLGLSVGWISAASTPDERRQAYRRDLVYVTAKEVAFDHLRDRSAKAQGQTEALVLRGLCMAVIDEADSILIDEACTPLVLSQTVQARQAEQHHRLALFLAQQLHEGRDYHWGAQQSLTWTAAGQERLDHLSAHLQGPWKLRRHREEQLSLALTALHLLVKDVHYLLRDGEVHIIDGTTGRLALGRAWSRGLHQMVCIKEGLPPTPEIETLTQTTYQEFFPRYHRLCGLSGTLWEERRELLSVYGLPVARVPLRQPGRRLWQGTAVAPDMAAKWRQVAERAMARAAAGQAVLVGTQSVADSEALSAVLSGLGAAHRLLNARLDGHEGQAERQVVEVAGRPGAITVATHMAGRGTDIHVQPAALAQGGLHVINTHLNDSARVDRQLYGRAARQGQPGSCECVLSWADEPLKPWARQRLTGALVRTCQTWPGLGPWLTRGVCGWIQALEGRRAFWRRWSLLQLHLSMRRQLAWAGRDEWS